MIESEVTGAVATIPGTDIPMVGARSDIDLTQFGHNGFVWVISEMTLYVVSVDDEGVRRLVSCRKQ